MIVRRKKPRKRPESMPENALNQWISPEKLRDNKNVLKEIYNDNKPTPMEGEQMGLFFCTGHIDFFWRDKKNDHGICSFCTSFTKDLHKEVLTKGDETMAFKEEKGIDFVMDWKEGQSITGKLVNIQENVGKHESLLYEIEQKDGEIKGIFGSAMLVSRMRKVEVGDTVRITFEGLEPTEKGNDMKKFKVEKDH